MKRVEHRIMGRGWGREVGEKENGRRQAEEGVRFK
jgi:hypothetical protein